MEIVFTHHAEYRLEKRKISKEEAEDAIKHPDALLKKHGLYYYQKKLERGTIELVCEKTEKSLNVITVYWV